MSNRRKDYAYPRVSMAFSRNQKPILSPFVPGLCQCRVVCSDLEHARVSNLKLESVILRAPLFPQTNYQESATSYVVLCWDKADSVGFRPQVPPKGSDL